MKYLKESYNHNWFFLDEMISVGTKTTAAMSGSSSPSPVELIDGMEPGVDCEVDYADDYYDNYDSMGSGTTESMMESTTEDIIIISTTTMESDTTTEQVGSGDDEMGSGEVSMDKNKKQNFAL